VVEELFEYGEEIALPKDQEVVEQLTAHGAHPALGVCVRARAAEGQADDLDTLTRKDMIETRRERGVPVAKQEADSKLAIAGLPHWPPKLTLEDSELVAESQDLGPKLGVRAQADEDEVSKEADERVGDGEDHGATACRLTATIRRLQRPRRGYSSRARRLRLEPTAVGLRDTNG
jgi:hypothetical protein